MDPLSIIASTIAIATPVTICLRKFRANRHARTDLLLLANEVAEIVVLLQDLDQILRQRGQSAGGQANPRLLQNLDAAKAKLTDLADQMAIWQKSLCPNGTTTKSRPHIWIMIESKVKLFKEELQKIRVQMMTVLSMMSISGTTRVEIGVQDVFVLTKDTAQRQLEAQTQLQEDMSRKHEEIETLLRSFSLTQDPQSRITARPTHGSMPTSADQSHQGQTSYQRSDEEYIKAFHHNGSVLFNSSQMTAVAAVGIRAVQFPKTSCTPWCSCTCHQERRIRTPRFLERFIGSLFIGYSGMPVFKPPCSETTCHLRSQPLTYVTYLFPQWFLSRMVTFMMTTTPLAGPVASLKVQRTVPGSADIFTFAKLGDVDGMRTLFEKGLASPHDVHFDSGITALHMAINHQHVRVCKFLLQANADPFLSDFTQCTSADSAWTKILSRSLPPAKEQTLRSLFSETECVERRDFTVLHKIVLGLISNDLEQQLTASTSDLNSRDTIGRTALSMAAERNSTDHVRNLLSFNADHMLGSFSFETPLHYAASAKEPQCTQLLLDAGAIVDALTNWHQTPLHLSAAYSRNARQATLLLDAGADPNRRDRDGITPLGWTAISNNPAVAAVLLDWGADVHDLDLQGSSTLLQCIRSNRHEILRLLVPKAPRVAECFPRCQSVWDVIAASADGETMGVLRRMDFTGVTDCVELTVGCPEFESLVRRSDSSQELVAAFRGLVEYARALQCWEVDEDGDEVWEDAPETFVD